ncbi:MULTISPECIES: hypothetical protein [Actinosynnema]|uniref:hypothetical protein n=1 Tax=Actinosynnema TaxID=40566 RepID=UPI0020A2C6F6|nr:hypothetical protein [Actinosynnema pretiosum]MCP2094742.1 hypothetical protein [Actinosynnema pretiosum]
MIEYEYDKFVNFRHFAWERPHGHAFRWVLEKRFELVDADATDWQVVRALIDHEHFRDAYAGGGVEPEGQRHGPYLLKSITVEAYEAVNKNAVIEELASWTRRFAPAPPPLLDALAVLFDEVFGKATSLYRLKDLGRGAFHD